MWHGRFIRIFRFRLRGICISFSVCNIADRHYSGNIEDRKIYEEQSKIRASHDAQIEKECLIGNRRVTSTYRGLGHTIGEVLKHHHVFIAVIEIGIL